MLPAFEIKTGYFFRYRMMNTTERFTLGKNESFCGDVSCLFME